MNLILILERWKIVICAVSARWIKIMVRAESILAGQSQAEGSHQPILVRYFAVERGTGKKYLPQRYSRTQA